MNGGEIIAKVLQQHGVKFLFTLSGGHIAPIFVSAEQIGIKVVDTRHEVNAVFAADAVSRLTGVPGVAVVTAGPGVTNTITAIKNASLAQSPLVLLGGAAATMLKGRGALQDIDQLSLMKSTVKWATSITKVHQIVPKLEKAFQMAQSGVPGPVFVECPIDILYNEDLVLEWYGASSEPPKNIQERVFQWYVKRHARRLFAGKGNISFNGPREITIPRHNSAHISRAVSMIQKAERPLLLVGSGAMMNPKKAEDLAKAINQMGIPVYLSGTARGLLGKESYIQFKHRRRNAVKDADLIILAGVPNDFRMDYGNHIGGRPFISINRSREDLYKNKRPNLAINRDPQNFLIDLGNQFQGDYTEWKKQLKKREQERETQIDEQAAENLGGINPLELFRKLDPKLKENTILVADGGDFVATAAYTLRPRTPLSWLDPGVFGTLGVGAGFAIGAKLVYPEKDVWIIYGDGSAGYSLVENDTFVRHKLPIVSLIGNDAAWGQIARDQLEILKHDTALFLSKSDYQIIGKAFGADGKRAETIEEFETAVKEANESIKKGVPFIINAILGKSDFRKGSISM